MRAVNRRALVVFVSLAAALFASCAACAVGCIVVPFLKAPAARIPISILMATAVAVDLLFHHLNGNFLRLGMVQTLWSGLPWAGDILPAYRAEILWCVLGAVAFGLILSLRPPAQRALPLRWAAVSCIRIGVNVVFHRDQ